MENTIKGKEVIAYKYMDKNMCCSGFQYEVGKTYTTDKVKLYKYGFHACLNPQDMFVFYSQGKNSRYFKVKLSGEIAKCSMWDTDVAATKITILEEITDTFNEVIKTTEWWKSENVLNLLYFSDGFARVKRVDRKYNFIDKNGNYLFAKWFYFLGNFKEDFAIVQRANGEWNFINKDGNYLSNEWFYNVFSFYARFARVRRANGEWCQIDKTGKLIKNLQ